MKTAATYVPQQVIERGRTIAWLAALGAGTAEALAVRDELSVVRAQGLLDEATGLELLEKHSVLVGYSDLYSATYAGRKLARRYAEAGGYAYVEGLRPAHVTIREARHAIATASVVAALEHRYPDYRIIGERQLHLEEREQKRRLASVEVRLRGGTRSKFPDAVVWPPAVSEEEEIPLPIAVEVELTHKSREYLRARCRAMANSHLIEATLYYVEDKKVEEKLLEVIEELKAEDMIVVNPLSAIIDPIPGFPLTDEY
jgi:hypothetical protein